jgi:hypothetical protein
MSAMSSVTIHPRSGSDSPTPAAASGITPFMTWSANHAAQVPSRAASLSGRGGKRDSMIGFAAQCDQTGAPDMRRFWTVI